jgi:dephospho-CoA kinase
MSNIKCNAVVVGITGGIACGKSEVGRILGAMGFATCDADQVAHRLMARGMPVYHSIVAAFGGDVLDDEKEISRSQLGKIVFDHPDQRLVLNHLVHPAVYHVLEQWISERRTEGENAAVQLPLLFESGMNVLDWDAVICVSSEEPQVYERLERRGINRQEARQRIDAQMPLLEKERLSDQVIRNIGTLQELEKATRMVVDDLIAER